VHPPQEEREVIFLEFFFTRRGTVEGWEWLIEEVRLYIENDVNIKVINFLRKKRVCTSRQNPAVESPGQFLQL